MLEYKKIWPKCWKKPKNGSDFHFFGQKSEKLDKGFIFFIKKLQTFKLLLQKRSKKPFIAKKSPVYAQSSRRVDAFNLLTPNAESSAFIASLNKLIKDTNDAWKLHKAQLGRWTEEGGREEEEESPKAPTEYKKLRFIEIVPKFIFIFLPYSDEINISRIWWILFYQ